MVTPVVTVSLFICALPAILPEFQAFVNCRKKSGGL